MKNPNNTHSKKNPVGRFMVAVGAVIEHVQSGNILIIKRNKNLDWHPDEWEILYGRMNQFEKPEQAIEREIYEETGLKDVKIIDVLRVWQTFRGNRKAENELIGITYHCQTTNNTIVLSDEHSTYKWVNWKQALQHIVNEGIKMDIMKYGNTIK